MVFRGWQFHMLPYKKCKISLIWFAELNLLAAWDQHARPLGHLCLCVCHCVRMCIYASMNVGRGGQIWGFSRSTQNVFFISLSFGPIISRWSQLLWLYFPIPTFEKQKNPLDLVKIILTNKMLIIIIQYVHRLPWPQIDSTNLKLHKQACIKNLPNCILVVPEKWIFFFLFCSSASPFIKQLISHPCPWGKILNKLDIRKLSCKFWFFCFRGFRGWFLGKILTCKNDVTKFFILSFQ